MILGTIVGVGLYIFVLKNQKDEPRALYAAGGAMLVVYTLSVLGM
jgi:hypothetical protein